MPDDDLETLLTSGGDIASLVADVSTSAMQPPAKAEGRRREAEEALREAGADDALVAILLDAVVPVPGAGDPIGVAAVSDGTTTVRQPAPGAAPRTTAEVGRVPDLSELLRARERAVPVIVVEARSGGGDVRLFPAPGLAEVQQQDVTGEDVAVHQAHAGGAAQSAHAGSAEDALAQNARLLADRAVVAIRESGAAAVLVTGDARAAELFTRELPELQGVSVAALGKDTQAAGADPGDLAGGVAATVDGLLDAAHRDLVDRLSADSGRLGATGRDDVVRALQGAAVDVLLLGPDGAPGELLALGGEPWVAEAEGDALGAEVLGRVPAAAALIRAAILTGAPIRFPGPGVLPDGAAVAAHLRYPNTRP